MREFIVSEDFHPDVRGYRELIRCNNCKHWHESNLTTISGYGNCGKERLPTLRPSIWFCADGESKD